MPPEPGLHPDAITDFFRTPGELGWGNRRVNDDHDFIGWEALDAQRDAGGPARQLAGLIWNEDDIAALFSAQFRSGPLPEPIEMPREIGPSFDRVLVGGRDVGVSSGHTYSPALRKMISLVGIDRDRAQPGTDVAVLWGRPGTPQRENQGEGHRTAAQVRSSLRRCECALTKIGAGSFVE